VYLQVPPLGGSHDEKWRSQWIRKRSLSWNLPKLSQLWRCNGGFGSCTAQNHLQTKQFVNGTWNSSRVAACALRNEVAVRSHVACSRNLITGLTSTASPRVHISSSCKVGQKLGDILYPLICFFLLCLSWLLRSQFSHSRRDLWITLYSHSLKMGPSLSPARSVVFALNFCCFSWYPDTRRWTSPWS